MQFPEVISPLLVIVGPTAVGKTEISIQLAEHLEGEIVSADSRLFYRGMDIGTAKPTMEDRRRIPHHLIDVADPDEIWSLALFQRAAYQSIVEIHDRGRLPILVGGTGQYIRAIIEGWYLPAQQPHRELRVVLKHWADEIGSKELHRRLCILDPEAGKLIEPNNLRRTIRALEVMFCSGQRFSSLRQQRNTPFSLLIIGLKRPRDELYSRIDARINAMLEVGFSEEVRSLLARGYDPKLSTLSAIGYREMISYIMGEITFNQVKKQMKHLTRQFVRRQANWFKENDVKINWFMVDDQVVNRIEQLIRFGNKWILPEFYCDKPMIMR